MVSFSLPRNWARFMAESNNQIARDLRPINAIRLLTMFCVMMGHSALFMNIIPSSNPQYMEKVYKITFRADMTHFKLLFQSYRTTIAL